MRTIQIYLFIIVLLLFKVSLAQEYYFKKYQSDNGLTHNSVLSMLQDREGFMWFGTKDGLNRFDGYNFKVFQKIPGDSSSIGGNIIKCLYEFNGNIWVGTDSGLFKYDKKQESFALIEETRSLPIFDIDGTDDNSLYFIAAGTLMKINFSDPKINIEKYGEFSLNSVTHTSDNKIYVTTSNQIFRYDPKNNSFENIEINISGEDQNFTITSLSSYKSDTILLGTKDHGAFSLNTIDYSTKSLLPLDENPLFVRDFLVNKDKLWIASETGLFIYDLKNKSYQNLQKKLSDPYSLSDNAIYSMEVDHEGGIWIGTYFGGVNYFPKQYTPIKRYVPQETKYSLTGSVVREIKDDKYGNIWIGTEDAGLNKFDPKTGKFLNFTPENSKLSYYNIHGLLPIEDKLWIGTFEHGLNVMDIPTGKITRHYSKDIKESGLHDDFVFYLYKSVDNNLYALTAHGIHKYSNRNDSFSIMKGFSEAYHYTYLIEDHNGTFWAGTYLNGLYFYNPHTGNKGFYKHQDDNPNSLSSNVITGIFEDSKKRLWISTEHGLNLFDRKTQKFKNYYKTDGLPTNIICSILEEDDQTLWISTSNGLVHFDPTKETFKTYTKTNGLLSDHFNYSSAYKNENGKMFFGGVKGLVSFNPDEFVKNNYEPPIYITNLSIDNETVIVSTKDSPLEQSIIETKEITLNSDQSTFSLDFASLSYTAPEMSEYSYRLLGLNDKWIPLETKHSVNFTELPSGNYTFQVKSTNRTGIENNQTASLDINILPPFYLSKVAILFYILISTVLFILGMRYYHDRVETKNNQKLKAFQDEKEKEIYQAKIEFFTNVAHEIRTPLTLIKTPLEKLIGQSKNQPFMHKSLSIMEKNTERLINLVNELLDFRKTETENIKLTFVEINISEILRQIYNRFSELIEEKAIDFKMNFPQKDVIAYVDEEATKKIISNLLNNAIKYAKNEVILQLSTSDSEFELKIQNDGSLIPLHLKDRIFEPFFRTNEVSNQTGTGIGLSLAYSLTELHNGKLILANENTSLNTFILNLPLHQKREFISYKKKSKEESFIEDPNTEGILNNHTETSGILIVEDNIDLLKFIVDDFKENYTVFKTTNVETAIQILKRENIFLIISDVMMKGMDGLEFCQYVKTNIETSHIPIILLTAKSAIQSKIKGLEAGADAYIEKPFSLEHLKVQVNNLIENRKHIMEFYSSSPLSHIKSIAHTKTDEKFIKKLDAVIYDHLSDQNLNVDTLAEIMNMSRSTLYRKIKDISNLSPNELINIARLKKAAELLQSKELKVYEVADIVGYKSRISFSRNFQKQFKLTPSEYISGKHLQNN